MIFSKMFYVERSGSETLTWKDDIHCTLNFVTAETLYFMVMITYPILSMDKMIFQAVHKFIITTKRFNN